MVSVVEKRDNRVEKSLKHGEPVFEIVGSDDDSDLDDRSEFDHYKYRLLCTNDPPLRNIHDTGGYEEKEPRLEIDIGKSNGNTVTGLSFLIRRERGITARLFTKSLTLPVLIGGPYPTSISLSSAVSSSPHIFCIAGGVGIVAILPVLRARASADIGRTALYFGTRSKGLMRTCGLEELISRREALGIDVFVRMGRRWDLEKVVWQEIFRVISSLSQDFFGYAKLSTNSVFSIRPPGFSRPSSRIMILINRDIGYHFKSEVKRSGVCPERRASGSNISNC
ncbi:hypothetical protein L207DRAFT_570654 [Hyaloscypha variabilis F]|uniref:Ferric reductase NAD binding domain-containing protein n=1 Tax=Hyaloscypha variabilis (strain UAMH 11265 / GT02V1 / F) TaxID=1149755 RepID=A0A2J6R9B1_HYAVF|nr:hypothetical protein L207DRAFT_570654 [Hyaloscypha variabilis F]